MYGKQLELFDNGGLRDQGETRDPMSGNNVPVGSMQKEVRDDVPAMLSEGEFVLPADVVRYIGLDRLMKLRQDAKQGLENMNRMGQFGNSHEATIPDNLPYNQISPMAQQQPRQMPQQQMAQGGVPQGYHRMPDGRIMANAAHMNTGGMGTVGQQFQLLGQQTGGNQPEMIYGKNKSNLGVNQGASFVEYIDPETFERVSIRTIDGVPQEEVPEGYIPLKEFLDTLEPEDRAYFEENGELPPVDGQEEEEEEVVEEEGEEEPVLPFVSTNDNDTPPVKKSAFQEAGSWQMDTSATDGNALQMWIDEAEKVVNFGGITSGVVGAIGGGPLGALLHFANKHQKKTILEMIDSKIAQAQKTPIAGQVAALQELKAKLEGKQKKTGLSGVIDGIIDTIGDALGLGDKEKEKVKNIATKENDNAPSSEVTEEMNKPVEPTPDPSDAAYANLEGETDTTTDRTTISLTDDDLGIGTEPSEYELDTQTQEALTFGQDPSTEDPMYQLLENNIRTLKENYVNTVEDGVYSQGPRIGRDQGSGVDLDYVQDEDAIARNIGFASMEQMKRMVDDLNINKLSEIAEQLPLTEKTREVKERAEELLVEQGAATPEVVRRVQVRNYLKGILKPTKAPTTGTIMNTAGIGTGITAEMANDITNYLAKVASDPKVKSSATAAQSAVDDLLTTSTGERVDKATQRDIYYKAREEQERLAKLAAEAAARAKRARDKEAKRKAEEEAKRLADEAAKKAAEESAALGGKSGKQILYESLDPDVQTEVAASDEQIVMSQPVRNNNNDDYSNYDFGKSSGDSGSSYSTPSVTDYSGSTFEEKVASQGEDLAAAAGSTKKADGSYDISSWFGSKGGLAKPVFKSVRKPDTTRGLAARKK